MRRDHLSSIQISYSDCPCMWWRKRLRSGRGRGMLSCLFISLWYLWYMWIIDVAQLIWGMDELWCHELCVIKIVVVVQIRLWYLWYIWYYWCMINICSGYNIPCDMWYCDITWYLFMILWIFLLFWFWFVLVMYLKSCDMSQESCVCRVFDIWICICDIMKSGLYMFWFFLYFKGWYMFVYTCDLCILCSGLAAQNLFSTVF